MPELINVGLRSLTLGSKFVLLFFLARMLSPVDVGLYGLMAVTVGYGITALGMEFYTYATRELLSCDQSIWSSLVRDQTIFYAVVYTISLPFFLLLFYFGVLPWVIVGWFFALLVVEHLGQEINRLLIATGRPLMANAVLFVRSGLWVWIVLILMWFSEESRNLSTVFAGWTVGAGVAILLGVSGLRNLQWEKRAHKVNWPWIRRGIVVASVFLMASLFIKALFTLDRYIVQNTAGPDLLGVYTFYVGIAMAVGTLLDAGVFAFIYPRIVAAYRGGNLPEFFKQMRKLWVQVVVALATLLAGAAICIKPVLMLLDRPIYGHYLPVFWLLLLAVALYVLGMIPHYGLYAFGRDRAIVVSHALGLVVFLVVAFATTQLWPLAGVAVGFAAGLGVIFLVKLWQYRQLLPGVSAQAHQALSVIE